MESKCPLQFVLYQGEDKVFKALVGNYNQKIHELYAIFLTAPPMIHREKIPGEIKRHERELGVVLRYADKNGKKEWVLLNTDVIDDSFRYFQQLRRNYKMPDEIEFMAQHMGQHRVIRDIESSFLDVSDNGMEAEHHNPVRFSKFFTKLVNVYKRLTDCVKRFYTNSLTLIDKNKEDIKKLEERENLTDFEREMLSSCSQYYDNLSGSAEDYLNDQEKFDQYLVEEYVREQLKAIDSIDAGTPLEIEMLESASEFLIDYGH